MQLSGQQIGDVLDVLALGETFAYALLFGVRIRHEHSDSRVTWAVNHGHGLRLQKIRLDTCPNRLFWKRKSPGRPWRFPGRPARSYLDRKSTRLNSSH